MEIVNVPFRKLKIPLLKKLNNEKIYDKKLLKKLKYPRSLDNALKHHSCLCLSSRGIQYDF
jgi:hypothetical protein